jgi:hypothetical protein
MKNSVLIAGIFEGFSQVIKIDVEFGRLQANVVQILSFIERDFGIMAAWQWKRST